MNRPRRRLAFTGCLALVVGVLSVAMRVATAEAATPPAPGLIAYADGNDIHTMNADGSGTRLVGGSGYAWKDPAWSADGTKIAFGGPGIFTMRADGTHLRRLTSRLDEDPSWSPDGRHLVFHRYERDGYQGRTAIFRIDADGTHLTRLAGWGFQNIDATWSPDGSKIAYVRGFKITTMKADGSAKTTVPGLPPDAFAPAWSPDGTKFVFDGGNGCYDIYTVNTDGSDLTQLTTNGCPPDPTLTEHFDPTWSPDGTQLAFEVVGQRGNSAIFRTTANGSEVTRLTKWSQEARSPSWGPVVPWCGGHSATIIGTAGADTLIGGSGPDVIVGRGGDDTITGGGGNDIVCGDAGADMISGDGGNDTMYGSTGTDRQFGGTGNDRMFGNTGNDTLYGRQGDDVLFGGGGTDKLYGGTGTDRLYQ